MGKSVSYTINAKDKSKSGIDNATKGLAGLNNKLAGVGKMMVAAFSVAAIKKVGQEIQQLQQAFGVQLESELQLQKAVQNSSKLSLESAKRLKNFASELQNTSIFGDEQLIQYEAMLVAQGRTEEEIQKVLQASVDLASSGVMPLESAVKNISKTYAGMAGELGESIPALRELTKEQMENGEAVAVIAKQYEGMGKAVASGTKGTKQSLENVKGDIQETIGEILMNITGDINSKLLPIFTKINEWLGNNKTKIVNIFKNIPEVAKTAFQLIKDLAGQILSIEFFKFYGTVMWDFFLGAGKSALNIMFGFLQAIGTTIWEPLKYGFEIVTVGIKNGFANMINFFVERLNWFIDKYNELANSGFGEAFKMQSADRVEGMNVQNQKPENNIKNAISESWDKALSNMKDEVPNMFNEVTETWQELFEGAPELFGDEFDTFLSNMDDIVNEPLILDFKEDAINAISDAVSGGEENNNSPSSGGLNMGLLDGLGDSFGSLFETVTNLVAPLMTIFTSITSLSALFNWFNVIIESFIQVIAVPLNKLLAPIIGMLVIVGKTIGQMIIPIIQMLAPLLSLVSKAFVFLYNYGIRPLANAIIWVITGLNNAIAWAVNGIIDAVNKLPGVNIRWRMAQMDYDEMKMDEISEDDVRTEGENYLNNNGGATGYETTGSASYSAERDLYLTMNIEYNVGLSAFDDNDLAVKMTESIERAKDLGYI